MTLLKVFSIFFVGVHWILVFLGVEPLHLLWRNAENGLSYNTLLFVKFSLRTSFWLLPNLFKNFKLPCISNHIRYQFILSQIYFLIKPIYSFCFSSLFNFHLFLYRMVILITLLAITVFTGRKSTYAICRDELSTFANYRKQIWPIIWRFGHHVLSGWILIPIMS